MKDPIFWQAFAVSFIAAYAGLLVSFYVIIAKPLTMAQSSIQAQLTDIITRLTRIETKLDNHPGRITRPEERPAPLRRY